MKQALIILITAASCFACAKHEADRFYSEEHGFSIKFPGEWQVTRGYMGSVVRAENPNIPGNLPFHENMNIVADTIPEGMTIDLYFSAGKKLLRESLPDLKDEGGGSMLIDGHQAYWFGYSYSLKPVRMKVAVYNIIRKDKIFLITCTAESARFEKVKEIFEASAKSFKFQ